MILNRNSDGDAALEVSVLSATLGRCREKVNCECSLMQEQFLELLP